MFPATNESVDSIILDMFGCVRYSELCVRYIARTTVVVPLDHFGDHCWVCPFTRVLNVCSRENVRLLDLCGRHHVYPYTLNLYTLNLNRNPSPPRWLHGLSTDGLSMDSFVRE